MRGSRRLAVGEEVLIEARSHPFRLIRNLAVAFVPVALAILGYELWSKPPHDVRLVFLALGVLGILLVAVEVLTWRRPRVVVTSERVMLRGRGGRRARTEIPLRRIVAIRTDQSFLERLSRRGHLEFDVQGQSDPILFTEVSNPLRIARAIDAAIDETRGPSASVEVAGDNGSSRLRGLYAKGVITLDELRDQERRGER